MMKMKMMIIVISNITWLQSYTDSALLDAIGDPDNEVEQPYEDAIDMEPRECHVYSQEQCWIWDVHSSTLPTPPQPCCLPDGGLWVSFKHIPQNNHND